MDSELRHTLGEQIGVARRAARISQETLARYAGITRAHLSNYERGRVMSPKAEVLARITEKLHCKLVLNGASFGPEQFALTGRPKPRPAIQLNLPLEIALDAMRVLRAVQRGATLTLKKRRGRLVFQATFHDAKLA